MRSDTIMCDFIMILSSHSADCSIIGVIHIILCKTTNMFIDSHKWLSAQLRVCFHS